MSKIGRYMNLSWGAVETVLVCAMKTYRGTTDTVLLAGRTARSRLAVGDSDCYCSRGGGGGGCFAPPLSFVTQVEMHEKKKNGTTTWVGNKERTGVARGLCITSPLVLALNIFPDI